MLCSLCHCFSPCYKLTFIAFFHPISSRVFLLVKVLLPRWLLGERQKVVVDDVLVGDVASLLWTCSGARWDFYQWGRNSSKSYFLVIFTKNSLSWVGPYLPVCLLQFHASPLQSWFRDLNGRILIRLFLFIFPLTWSSRLYLSKV